METSLQSLVDLAGVNAAAVYDGAGRLVALRGKAIYDRGLCEQVGGPLSRAVDSVQLQHADWEVVTARYADGTVILRNLGEVGGGAYVLAVVADATLNPAFAAVAIRVAATKLKKALAGPATPGGSSALPATLGSSVGGAPAPGPGGSQAFPPGAHPAAASRPVLASSGVSWSRVGGSTFSAVAAADPAAGSFLSRCARELARHVGPMAKIYVEEAVRRLSPDATFTLALGPALLEELGGQIEDPKDRAAFRAAVEAAKAK